MKTSPLIWICLLTLNAFSYTCWGQSQPWVTWARNPLTIPVSIGVSNVLAETNTTVIVKLADGSITIDGYNCSEITNQAPFIANVIVRREYQLSVVATNFSGLDMKL